MGQILDVTELPTDKAYLLNQAHGRGRAGVDTGVLIQAVAIIAV